MSRRASVNQPTSATFDERTGVHEFTYANGLTLLVGERHSAPIVCSMIWYRTGSSAERAGQTGVSHFLEHLMFKGTRRFPKKGQIDALTQSLGGRNNAFTSRDYTAYYFLFAADRWNRALEIEADRMTGCLFDENEFDAERSVVLEEISRDLDSPWGPLEQELMSVAFRSHPYRHPILGWPEDLNALTPEKVRKHYRKHYHPGNAVCVICGDVDAADAARRVGQAYAGTDPGRRTRPPRFIEPPQLGERRVIVEHETSVPRLQVLFRTVPFGHPDYYVLEVIDALLTEGKSARLTQRMVEKGRLMRMVGTYNDGKRDTGLFGLYGDLTPGTTPARAERALHAELDRLGRAKVRRAELDRIRNQIATGFLFRLERTLEWAIEIGRHAVLTDHRDLGHYLERVSAVTAEDVQRVARTTFVQRNRVVGLAVPMPGRNGTPR